MEIQKAFHHWNEQQQHLRQALQEPNRHTEAIALFLEQHALLHATEVAQLEWSFPTAIVAGLSDEQWRRLPHGHEHSIAWSLWHVARIEDVTMNLLMAGSDQLLHRDSWLERLKISARDCGNEMSSAEIIDLSRHINIDALWAYRYAVGQRTRAIVQTISAAELKQAVAAERLQRVKGEGALMEAAYGIADYWGNHPKSNLLLMPGTRHIMVHLNEAERIRKKLIKSK